MKFICFVAPLVLISAMFIGCGGASNEVTRPDDPGPLPPEDGVAGSEEGGADNLGSPVEAPRMKVD
ncbi:MAG TPA: hypothetical protein EYG38_07405 [Verrucomicrobia bacterium]|nr:hypothetical protein [Verrucomicrobiota bacterium]